MADRTKLTPGKVYKIASERVVLRGWTRDRRKVIVQPLADPDPKSQFSASPRELKDWRT